MIPIVNGIAETWFRYMASATLQATFLALLLIGIVWVGRRWSPALRHALLMLALCKFVIPPMLSLPTGLFSRFKPQQWSESTPPVRYVAPIVQGVLWPAGEFKPVAALMPAARGTPGMDAQPGRMQALPAPFPPKPALTAKGGLLVLHLSGALLILALAAMQKFRLRRLAIGATPPQDPDLAEMYDEMCRSMNLFRWPQLLLSGDNHAPMTFGTWKPVVVLPPSGIRVFLGHELAHHHRWDLWLSWLQIPISALWWFNPIYWLLSRRIRSIREDCCDDLVVALGLASGEGYCRTLLQAARVASGNAMAGATLAYIGESQPLRRRFKRIMSAKFTRTPKLAGTGMLAVAALGLLLLPGVEPRIFTDIAAGAEALIENRMPAGQQTAAPAGPQRPQPVQESNLTDYYRKWLNEDVVYIITPEEKNVFLALRTDEERGFFIEQFWARRDPDPRRGGNQFKEEHYRRIGYANERFKSKVPGWQPDRGRIFILYGESDGKESHPTDQSPFERWRYRHIDRIGDNVEFEFVDKTLDNTYILTTSPLRYALRFDFIRLSVERVIVPITMELENQDLQQWEKQTLSDRDQIVVYGAVTNMQGRFLAEFEHTISAEDSVETLGPGTARRITWQKKPVLPPGQEFVLHWSLKDTNGRNIIQDTYRLLVPKFTGEELQASSIILANSVYAVPPKGSDPSDPFLRTGLPYVFGDMKVEPNVKSEYVNGQHLIAYLEVYNAALDAATQAPSLQISYPVKSDDQVLIAVEDPGGKTVQSASVESAVIIGLVRVENLPPGKYTLEIKVVDRIANRSLVSATDFRIVIPSPSR